MVITNITSISDIEYQNSKKTTKRLVDKIKNKKDGSSAKLEDSSNQQEKFKSSTAFYDNLLRNLSSKMTPAQLKANDIATSGGASIWLSSLPLKHERFSLAKGEFFDAVLLKIWMGHECVYKTKYNINHALTCKTRGPFKLRHNEIVNVTADMLSIVSKDVKKEPTLNTTPDNNDEFGANISLRSFGQRFPRPFVDVRDFYPFAPSYQNQSLATIIKTKENQKKKNNQ